MKNYHLIEAKYMGATNTTGSRMKLTSLRFGDSITESYSYKFGNINDQAQDLLKSLGFKLDGVGFDEKKGVYIFASTTFESLKESKKSAKFGLSAKGWHKDHYNYNKAESYERKPAARRTPARNVTKTGAKRKRATSIKKYKR
jgi:hypothetical protein